MTAVTGLDPQMPAKMAQVTITATPRPFGMEPTQTLANSNSSSPTLDSSTNMAASTNNGIVTNSKLLRLCQRNEVKSVIACCRPNSIVNPPSAAMPMAMKIGTPRAISPNITPTIRTTLASLPNGMTRLSFRRNQQVGESLKGDDQAADREGKLRQVLRHSEQRVGLQILQIVRAHLADPGSQQHQTERSPEATPTGAPRAGPTWGTDPAAT